jgi:PhnB protein
MDISGPVALRSAAGSGKLCGMPANTSGPPVISVMLIVPDAGAAVAWYRAALGATELWNLGGVAGLSIGGAAFFVPEVNPSNPAESSPGGVTSVRVELFCDDPDAFVGRALAAGAIRGSAVVEHQMPWGVHRQGGFTDPFGHKWSVGDRSPLR